MNTEQMLNTENRFLMTSYCPGRYVKFITAEAVIQQWTKYKPCKEILQKIFCSQQNIFLFIPLPSLSDLPLLTDASQAGIRGKYVPVTGVCCDEYRLCLCSTCFLRSIL